MNIFKLPILSLLFGVFGCVVVEPKWVTNEPLATDALVKEHSETLFVAINNARHRHGLASLTQQIQLQETAQSYAEVLARAGRIAHSGVDGTTLKDRVESSGYQYRTFNENLSAGYPTANLAVAGWMNSPGHKTNLLNSEIAELGVGYARAGDGDQWVHYWVMVGGKSR